ncbi:MAG: hypothetical protein ACYTGW_06605 [Planctomycetota bacterium]|jgi:hypothetical protein
MRYSLLALSLVLAAPAYAQTANPHNIGFIASFDKKSVGACTEFSCVPRHLDINAVAGTNLSLSVFGGNDMPFLIAASAGAGSCIPVPGLVNNFALDAATTVLLAAGTLRNDAVNPCGRAKGTVQIAVPANVAVGDTVAFQALSFSSPDVILPALSRPIIVTAAPASDK